MGLRADDSGTFDEDGIDRTFEQDEGRDDVLISRVIKNTLRSHPGAAISTLPHGRPPNRYSVSKLRQP